MRGLGLLPRQRRRRLGCHSPAPSLAPEFAAFGRAMDLTPVIRVSAIPDQARFGGLFVAEPIRPPVLWLTC